MAKRSDSMASIAELPLAAGTVTGILSGLTPAGEPLVDIGGEDGVRGVVARTCVALQASDVGREAVLVFQHGKLEHPIILGLLRPARSARGAEAEVDGRTVVLSGEESVVLRCGEASITLNRDGKVVIRGQHVVSHASGVNRIRGGSVQLN